MEITEPLDRMRKVAGILHESGFHVSHDLDVRGPMVVMPINHHNIAAISLSQKELPAGKNREHIAALQKTRGSGASMPEVNLAKAMQVLQKAVYPKTGFGKFLKGNNLSYEIFQGQLILRPRKGLPYQQ